VIKIVSKIRNPDILVKMGKAYSAGMSISKIQEMIEKENGIKAHTDTIRKNIELYKTRRTEIIQGDQELKKDIENIILDTKTQLTEVNNLMREILNDARVKKELRIAAANQILHQLEFQQKLLTRLTEEVKIQQVNKITISQTVINSLESLEKDGFIKIIKSPRKIR